MKLFSPISDVNNNKTVCEDCIFDPALASISHIDSVEKVIFIDYDFNECGHPLNLPFAACSVALIAKVTPHNIHISAMVDTDDENSTAFEKYADDLGRVEFGVRMSDQEKVSFLLFILLDLLNDTNDGAENDNDDAEKDHDDNDNEDPEKELDDCLDTIVKNVLGIKKIKRK